MKIFCTLQHSTLTSNVVNGYVAEKTKTLNLVAGSNELFLAQGSMKAAVLLGTYSDKKNSLRIIRAKMPSFYYPLFFCLIYLILLRSYSSCVIEPHQHTFPVGEMQYKVADFCYCFCLCSSTHSFNFTLVA